MYRLNILSGERSLEHEFHANTPLEAANLAEELAAGESYSVWLRGRRLYEVRRPLADSLRT